MQYPPMMPSSMPQPPSAGYGAQPMEMTQEMIAYQQQQQMHQMMQMGYDPMMMNSPYNQSPLMGAPPGFQQPPSYF